MAVEPLDSCCTVGYKPATDFDMIFWVCQKEVFSWFLFEWERAERLRGWSVEGNLLFGALDWLGREGFLGC